jgi:hypothetical protein
MASKEKAARIREILAESAGDGLGHLVEVLRARGVYTDDDYDGFARAGMMADARKALSERGTDDGLPGLPYAAPCEESSDEDEDGQKTGPRWLPLPLFDYEQMSGLLKRRGRGVLADHEVLVRLRDYCHARFGKAPDIVEVKEPIGSEL